MPSTAPHVQPCWPGIVDNGLGQFATGSYGPKRSQPPFSPATAAQPLAGTACPCTGVERDATRKPAANATATVMIVSTRFTRPSLSKLCSKIGRSLEQFNWHDTTDRDCVRLAGLGYLV